MGWLAICLTAPRHLSNQLRSFHITRRTRSAVVSCSSERSTLAVTSSMWARCACNQEERDRSWGCRVPTEQQKIGGDQLNVCAVRLQGGASAQQQGGTAKMASRPRSSNRMATQAGWHDFAAAAAATATCLCKAEGARQKGWISFNAHHMEAPADKLGQGTSRTRKSFLHATFRPSPPQSHPWHPRIHTAQRAHCPTTARLHASPAHPAPLPMTLKPTAHIINL